MRAEIFDVRRHAPLRVVRFVLEKHPGPSIVEVVPTNGSLGAVLARIGKRLHIRLGQFLVGQREVRMTGPNEVVIVKPAARRHWMGLSALEDADAVIAESLSGITA